MQFLKEPGGGAARKAGTAAAKGRVVVSPGVDMTYPNDQESARGVKELEGLGPGRREPGPPSRARRRLARVPAKWLDPAAFTSYLVATPIPDLNWGIRLGRARTSAKQ